MYKYIYNNDYYIIIYKIFNNVKNRSANLFVVYKVNETQLELSLRTDTNLVR